MKTYTAETSCIIELLLIIILSESQSKAAVDLVLGICLPVHVEPSDILHGSSCNLIMVTSAVANTVWFVMAYHNFSIILHLLITTMCQFNSIVCMLHIRA